MDHNGQILITRVSCVGQSTKYRWMFIILFHLLLPTFFLLLFPPSRCRTRQEIHRRGNLVEAKGRQCIPALMWAVSICKQPVHRLSVWYVVKVLQKQSLTSSSNLQGPVDLVVTAARPDDPLPIDQVQRVLVILLQLSSPATEILCREVDWDFTALSEDQP